MSENQENLTEEDAVKAPSEDKPSPVATTNEEKQSSSEASKEDEKALKKEETAADLLGANIEQVKVRKAKGARIYLQGYVTLSRPLTIPRYLLQISKGMLYHGQVPENVTFEDQENQRLMQHKW